MIAHVCTANVSRLPLVVRVKLCIIEAVTSPRVADDARNRSHPLNDRRPHHHVHTGITVVAGHATMQGRFGDAQKVLDKTSESKEEVLLRLVDIKEAAGIHLEYNDDVISMQSKGNSSEGE
ncbi:hypothetical protein Dsin_009851 [Dipteronia sinensis]|uniref:Uncharacterized protein n=1 Tax=Dipteronia sinensis TaxID=43782 RepID=A0AAE0ARE4_9ROSI|nr:hypothetical protein Dsin_009851 [Dipteronia sinensis]